MEDTLGEGISLCSEVDDFEGHRISSEESDSEHPDFDEENPVNGRNDAVHCATKRHQSEIADALKKMAQFKTKISTLEKDKSATLYNKRHDFRKMFCGLEETEVLLNKDRLLEKRKLKQDLMKVASLVVRFKQEVRHIKPGPKSLDSIKELMENTESSILHLKEQQRIVFEDMLSEERALDSEMVLFERRINNWSSTASTTVSSHAGKPSSARLGTYATQNTHAPPEVKQFEKFLVQTGGHYGGWDEIDHQLFVKLTKQSKAHEFIDIAVSELPTRTRADIEQHREWWPEYTTLRENKRKAIVKWKKMKEFERMAVLNKADESLVSKIKQTQRHAELVEKEKRERFAKLEEWKNAKEAEKKETLDEEKRRQEELALQNRDALERRRSDAKLKVAEYTARKQEEKEIQRFLVETRRLREEEARRVSEDDWKRIQERDALIVKKRQTMLKAKDVAREEKEERLAKLRSTVDVNVKRDPSRLLQPTKGWLHRQNDTEESNSSHSGRSYVVQKRAVPAWRQNPS